ncbi:MAG: LolA family protein [Bacteroidota bacterium]
MKYLTGFLLLFSCTVDSFSQDTIQAQDPAAEPYLDNIAEQLKTEDPYQVEFRYEIYSALHDASVADYGSIIVKENKYKLKTEDTQVFFNGKKLWVYNPEAEEVYKSEPNEGDPDQMLADPFRLLGNYKKYYKYLFKGEQTIGANHYFQIDLYPDNLDAGYSTLRIFCTEGGKNIHSIILKQKNGLEITAYINEIIRNIKIPESTFSWNQETHPEVLLIEM